MKKGISPLIAYILLVGMVVAMSVIVSSYLKKQAQDINFEFKEIEVYCTDVAIDAELVCQRPSENEEGVINEDVIVLGFNLINRGYYSASNFIISSKTSEGVQTIDPVGYQWNIYETNGFLSDVKNKPIPPNKKALLVIVGLVKDTGTEIIADEITITPSIIINNKGAICNEKVFKLPITISDTSILGLCP